MRQFWRFAVPSRSYESRTPFASSSDLNFALAREQSDAGRKELSPPLALVHFTAPFPHTMAGVEKDYNTDHDKEYDTAVVTRGSLAEQGEGERVPPENDLHRGLKARQYVPPRPSASV